MIGMLRGDWFAPKKFGYGAGLPIAWQGWLVLAAYVGTLAGAGLAFLPDRTGAFFGMTVVTSVMLVVVAARHTRGGWRWRRGERD